MLARTQVEIVEIVDAKRIRLGAADALALARKTHRVIVAKGKSIHEFDMHKSPPDNDVLLRHLLGPTGNLRAPTIRLGMTVLAGFNAEVYQKTLSSEKTGG